MSTYMHMHTCMRVGTLAGPLWHHPQTLPPASSRYFGSKFRQSFAGFAHVGSRPWPVVPFYLAQLGHGLTEWFATMHG